MTRRLMLTTVALLAGSVTTTAAQDAAEVRAVIERHYAAIHSGDLETVFNQHLPDMTWYPLDGRVMFESGAVDAAARIGATLGYGTINVYMNDFSAQIYGNVAVATFLLVDTSVVEGEMRHRTSRVTAVWVKEGNEWKEAHHHESQLTGTTHP